MDTPTISNSSENTNSNISKPLSFSAKLKIKKAKFLSSYYGHPIEDIDLIIFAGKYRELAAKITHGALTALGQKSSLLDTKIAPTSGTINKFLSDSWKIGANFAIVPTPVFSLTNMAFYGLPIKLLSLTSEFPPDKSPEITSFCQTNAPFTRKSTKSRMKITVWQDQNSNFSNDFLASLSKSPLTNSLKITTTGFDRSADLTISNIRTYKQGTEATITYGSDNFKIATFDTSENIAEALAAATSALFAMGYTSADITDAIADWDASQTQQ